MRIEDQRESRTVCPIAWGERTRDIRSAMSGSWSHANAAQGALSIIRWFQSPSKNSKVRGKVVGISRVGYPGFSSLSNVRAPFGDGDNVSPMAALLPIC